LIVPLVEKQCRNTCMFVISEMLILITQDQAQIEVCNRRLPHMQFVGPRVPSHSQGHPCLVFKASSGASDIYRHLSRTKPARQQKQWGYRRK
jgi:hypothetical protein